MAEHGWKTVYEIRFSDIRYLFQSLYWGDWIVRESMMIRLITGALNCEDGMSLSSAGLPALELISHMASV